MDVDRNQKLQAEGTWDQIKGNARSTWGDITDDELDQARGSWEQFVGMVKEKTGETMEAIAEKFDEWTDGDDDL